LPASARVIIAAGSLLAALGVACGAFGAHALKQRLSADLLGVWQTAVQYHLWHALGVVLIGAIAAQLSARAWTAAAAGLLIAGILLFSGSLYALALGGPRQIGMLTPVGGLALIAGWICLLVSVLRG